MKKLLSFLLALTLLLSAAGCMPLTPTQTEPVTTADSLQIPLTTVPETTLTQPETTEPEVTEPTATKATEPPRTEPEATQPVVTEPPSTLPPQTDPERQPQEPLDEPEQTEPTEAPTTLPPQTEPPTTLPPQTDPPQTEPPATEPYLDPNGSYTYKDDVALYIHLYGRLPNNFITKSQADDRYGTTKVSKYGLCIGGDRFYNREGLLPGGYTYYECDIGTLYSNSRGQKRLVFTYSGLIYYTSDHYRSFTLLYGNP